MLHLLGMKGGSEPSNLLISQPIPDGTSFPLLPGKQQIPILTGEEVPAKGGCSLLEQQALQPMGHSAVGCHLSAKTSLACVNATALSCSVPFSTDADSQVFNHPWAKQTSSWSLLSQFRGVAPGD